MSLMTVDEVAEHLRVSRLTVRRMAARGELRGSLIARQWRFEQAAVDDLVAERENVTTRRRRQRRTA